jgi:tRNA 2-thiouridine synthesizing protein A
MSNIEKVDARGLSCPEPVMRVEKAIKKIKDGTIEVLVDTATARENVLRLAKHSGWTAEVANQPQDTFLLTLKK